MHLYIGLKSNRNMFKLKTESFVPEKMKIIKLTNEINFY